MVHGGYAAESDALKQTLESFRPQVAGNRLRFDQILKAGVAQVQKAQQLWSQSNPALAASPGEGDAISLPAAKALWRDFMSGLEMRSGMVMQKALTQMATIGITIPPMICRKVQQLSEQDNGSSALGHSSPPLTQTNPDSNRGCLFMIALAHNDGKINQKVVL